MLRCIFAAMKLSSPNQYIKAKFLRSLQLFKIQSTKVTPASSTTGYKIKKRKSFFPKDVKFFRRGTRDDFLYTGTFHEAISPVLIMAQLFGVLPVIGVRNKNPLKLHFKWFCFRTIYAIVGFIVLSAYTCLTIAWAMHGEITFSKLVPIIFYGSNAIIVMRFLVLARHWPSLMEYWTEIESKLPKFLSEFEKRKLSYKVSIITITVMMLSLIEHLLAMVTIFHYSPECPPRIDPIKDFFVAHLNQLFYFISYSPLAAFLGKIVNVIGTFTWSFMDLFVMLISVGISTRFKQLNDALFRVKGQVIAADFWAEHRVNYRNLCQLCDKIDDSIALITMISFSNNLYFICVQLLRSLNPMRSIAHGVYFWFSLLYLIGRTLAVSLYSADINSESKRPIQVFRAVPRESWCTEVKRFSEDVTNDTIALTGMKFFYLTRSLVLSVAGTIVTYELVLIQFHTDEVSEKEKFYC